MRAAACVSLCLRASEPRKRSDPSELNEPSEPPGSPLNPVSTLAPISAGTPLQEPLYLLGSNNQAGAMRGIWELLPLGSEEDPGESEEEAEEEEVEARAVCCGAAWLLGK